MNHRLFTFVGGELGPWRVLAIETIVGAPLAGASRLDILGGSVSAASESFAWTLRGIRSNERYATSDEHGRLAAVQPVLGRPEAVRAALIPIRKTATWWSLPQDERRRIFEEQSNHIRTGLKYLPAVARRLYHCRDLGENEPFDFLTWFEYAPSDANAFDELVAELRAAEEWKYVEREIDIRLTLESV